MNALAAEVALQLEIAWIQLRPERFSGTFNFECDALSIFDKTRHPYPQQLSRSGARSQQHAFQGVRFWAWCLRIGQNIRRRPPPPHPLHVGRVNTPGWLRGLRPPRPGAPSSGVQLGRVSNSSNSSSSSSSSSSDSRKPKIQGKFLKPFKASDGQSYEEKPDAVKEASPGHSKKKQAANTEDRKAGKERKENENML